MTLPISYLSFSGKLLVFLLYQFAIPHHLKTFFSPYHKMAETSNRPGFHFDELMQNLSFNLISVTIGIIGRTIVILCGLAFIFTTLVGLLFLFPFFVILSPLILASKRFSDWQQKNQVSRFVNSAKDQPCKTLEQILTQTEIGKFCVQKLAINTSQLNSICDPKSQNSLILPISQIRSVSDLIIWFNEKYIPFKDFLVKKKIDERDLQRIFTWFERLHPHLANFRINLDEVKKMSGFGSNWSFGYTLELDKYTIKNDYSSFQSVVGREEELVQIAQNLSKTIHSSVILHGPPGVGRHAIVDEFARRIDKGQVSANLTGFRVVYLDPKAVVSAFPTPAESRQKISDLFAEAKYAGNVIIVIDDLEKWLETTGEKLDISDLLQQHLADGKLRVIGLTSSDNFDRIVSQNSTILNLFNPVVISPPNLDTVFEELELTIAPALSKKHQIAISYIAIKKAVTDANRFISSTPFPEKAIDLLDETIVFTKNLHPHMKTLWDDDVETYLSSKLHIPVGTLTSDGKAKLANLETALHQRVIGQEEAIVAVSKALRRSVLEISDPKKPVGSFLFLGPTGVGKTETAKALAAQYFGNESRMVRFDMSEFQGEEGIAKLIGSQTTKTPGELTTAIANNPFSVLLLDEIEKAPSQILNLFLSLLDEGYLTDAFNHQVSVRQMIIIGTSNAGGLFIKNQVLQNPSTSDLQQKLIDYVQEQKIFSPEFLNRFDSVIVFKPLTFEQTKQVAQLMLNGLQTRLAEKQIPFSPSPLLVEKIIKEGYDPAFGARSIKRYIQDVVEDEVSNKILSE